MEKPHLLPLLRPPSNCTAAAAEPPDEVTSLNKYKKLTSHVTASNSSILFRLCFLVLISMLSIWANHEASKGYAITIVNESPNTFSGKRFKLLYVSNDEAIRVIIKVSKIIENFLYPDRSHDSNFKKPVSRVTLKLSREILTDDYAVESGSKHDEFVLNVSPSIMATSNFRHAMSEALQKGMARVWLWDGRRNAPANLINGIVEYMTSTNSVGSQAAIDQVGRGPCWKHNDARAVAGFLGYCERRWPGFLRRLNQAMREGWDDGVFDGVVGQPVENMCEEYGLLRYNFSSV